MKIVRPTIKLARMCDVIKCTYVGYNVYFLMYLTEEDCKRLRLKDMVRKALLDEIVHPVPKGQLCIHFIQICPKHVRELLKQHKDYILWCSI